MTSYLGQGESGPEVQDSFGDASAAAKEARMTTIYGIKNCDTMKKARAWLDAHGVDYAFHDHKVEDVTADRVRVNRSNKASPSPQRIARCSIVTSSVSRCRISSTASRLLRKTSRHIVGSDAAMRVKSRKPPAE